VLAPLGCNEENRFCALFPHRCHVAFFIKPLAAWMVAADGFRSMRRIRMRTVVLFVALVAGGLGVASLAVMCKWMFLDGISVKQGVSITVNEVAKFLSTDFSLSERLPLAWNAFWCEPMMLRESVIGQGEIVHDYRTFLPHILGAAVLALCVWSAIRNRRLPVVRAALSMVVFDFLLHVVVGWGTDEGQIYCGHWFWAIPLLVVLLPRRVVPVVLALVIGIAAQNLSVVFS